MNNSLLYLTLALVCIWVVLSQFFEDKYITRFVVALMPSAKKDGWFSTGV